MEYQVPQFIEVEDKIFGPFTLKQFIYVAGGVGLCAMLVYKVNNKSFVELLESGFKFYTTSRLYLWKREPKTGAQSAEGASAAASAPERAPLKNISRSKLHELAWSLDVKDTMKRDNHS